MRIYRIINPELIEKSKKFIIELEEKKEQVVEATKKITPFKWSKYKGWEYSWNLLPEYCSFIPNPKLDVAPEGWRFDNDGELRPNKRTKVGRKATEELNNLPFIRFDYPDKILGLNHDYNGRFVVPMIYKSHDNTEFFYKCDKRFQLDSSKFEEVLLSYVENRLNPPK